MKEQVKLYDFEMISSRMGKKYGEIEKDLVSKYAEILFFIESNLLRVYRKYGIDNDRRVIEAIHICLLIINGYLEKIEYNLDSYITDSNQPYYNILLMSFDPFTNEDLRPVVERRCDIQSKEGLFKYFEAPVKALLCIEKNVEFQIKGYNHNGYFSHLEELIGKDVANDDRIECIIVTNNENEDVNQLSMKDLFPNMDLHEVLTELIPTVSKIFELGFIPSPEEIYEFTEDQYAAYRRQGGDITEKLYTLIPKNYKYLGPPNEINMLSQEDTFKLGKAAVFLYIYARENGCTSESSDDVLSFTAKRLPAFITANSKYKRPPVKLLNPGEIPLTAREEVIDLLAHVMGEGATLNIKITDEATNKTEEISIPIEKQSE